MNMFTKHLNTELKRDIAGLSIVQLLPVLNIALSTRYEAINKPWFFPDKWLYLICWIMFSWGFLQLVKEITTNFDPNDNEIMRIFYLMWGVYLLGSLGFLGFGLGFVYIFMSLGMTILFLRGYNMFMKTKDFSSLTIVHASLILWLILCNIAGLYMLFNIN